MSFYILLHRVVVPTTGVNVTALPHCLTSNDKYRNFDVPGGCMVMPNIWCVHDDFGAVPKALILVGACLATLPITPNPRNSALSVT